MVVDLRKARVRARFKGGTALASALVAIIESASSGKLSKNADEEVLVVEFLISSSTPSRSEGLRFL